MERLEIRISNDRAMDIDGKESEPSRIPIQQPQQHHQQQQAIAVQTPPIPVVGLASTSSNYRTPMAVMDLYTGRYARPSLEPYRPPPLVQQFYRSLQETTPIGHIPSTTTVIQAAPPQYQPAYAINQPASVVQTHTSTPTIRKPYDYD